MKKRKKNRSQGQKRKERLEQQSLGKAKGGESIRTVGGMPRGTQ